MKFSIGLAVVLLTICNVLALPARSPSDDAEVISVPTRSDKTSDTDFKDFKGVIDTGVGYPFFQPNPNPFSFKLGFFDSFDDIFHRLRTQLLGAARPVFDDKSSEESDIGFNIDPKKANTTSTVKVVDGHRVEVNETLYGNDNGVFKVRIVNIRPLASGEDVTETENNVPTNAENPSTSAPQFENKNNNNRETENDDDSDERREPLSKPANENEISNGNIDDPEVKY